MLCTDVIWPKSADRHAETTLKQSGSASCFQRHYWADTLLQGTGTADEMALEERTTISTEGCVIADVAIVRQRGPPPQLQASASGQDRSAAPAEAEAGVRPFPAYLCTCSTVVEPAQHALEPCAVRLSNGV